MAPYETKSETVVPVPSSGPEHVEEVLRIIEETYLFLDVTQQGLTNDTDDALIPGPHFLWEWEQ